MFGPEALGILSRKQGIVTGVDVGALFIGMIAGAIGTGYFIYGKRQQRFAPMLAGLMLGIYPFFTNNPWLLVLIGAALMAAPFLLDF
jgi:hypothetical protein